MKYQQVAELFSKAKYPSKGKPMQSNVRLHMEHSEGEGTYVLKLHGSVIIRWFLDGMITISDCGYRTPTTYRNLNRYLPSGIHLYRKDFKTEVNLKRTNLLGTAWSPMKHITKPIYDTEPFNYSSVSPMEKLYGKRATYMTLVPTGVSQHDEYAIETMWQVIV